MGGRYLRTFDCDDCGTTVTRMWQGGRARVCGDCARQRIDIAATAAHEAVEAHKRNCRLELMARRIREAEARPAGPVWPAGLTGEG